MAVHVPPRIYRRVPFETAVRFQFDRFRGFVEEHSADLSLGGMFIKTEEPPPVGTVLPIEFRLDDGFELIRGTGKVIWVRDEERGPEYPAGVGLRFLELTAGSRELIFRVVERRVREGEPTFDLDEAGRPLGEPEPAETAPDGALAPPSWTLPALEATDHGVPGVAAGASEAAAGEGKIPSGRTDGDGGSIQAGAGDEAVATAVGLRPPAAEGEGTAGDGASFELDVAPPWRHDPPRPRWTVDRPESAVRETAPDGAAAAGTGDGVAESPADAVGGSAGSPRAAGLEVPSDRDLLDELETGGAARRERGPSAAAGWTVAEEPVAEPGGAWSTADPIGDDAADLPPVHLAAAGPDAAESAAEEPAAIGPPAAESVAAESAAAESAAKGSAAAVPVDAVVETAEPDAAAPPAAARGARHTGRWAAVAAGLLAVLGLLGFLGLRGRGAGGVSATPATPAGPRRAASGSPPSPAGEKSAATAERAPAATSPAGGSAPAEQPPGEAARAVAAMRAPPAAAPPGPITAGPARRIRDISWSEGDGHTEFVISADGPLSSEGVSSFSLGGSPPRLVVRIPRIEEPFGRGRLEVGGERVERIRTGLHAERGRSELHVVFDLARPGVRLAGLDVVGGRLRVSLADGATAGGAR